MSDRNAVWLEGRSPSSPKTQGEGLPGRLRFLSSYYARKIPGGHRQENSRKCKGESRDGEKTKEIKPTRTVEKCHIPMVVCED
jgi:hypothetical protein